MKVSSQGLKRIIKHEGSRNEVYLDPVGLPTVGIGHLLTPAEKAKFPVGTKVTKAQVEEWFASDIEKFENTIRKLVKVPINQNQFDSLVSLAFNIGQSAFQNSSVLRRLNRKDYAGAAESFKLWDKGTVKGKKVALPGLVKRRADEAKWFLTPVAPTEVIPIHAPPDVPDVTVTTTTTISPAPPQSEPDSAPSPDPVNSQQPQGKPAVSSGSIFAALTVGSIGAITWAMNLLVGNPIILVTAAILIIVALAYWSKAKDRATARHLSQ